MVQAEPPASTSRLNSSAVSDESRAVGRLSAAGPYTSTSTSQPEAPAPSGVHSAGRVGPSGAKKPPPRNALECHDNPAATGAAGQGRFTMPVAAVHTVPKSRSRRMRRGPRGGILGVTQDPHEDG